jgi:hypothetical protein
MVEATQALVKDMAGYSSTPLLNRADLDVYKTRVEDDTWSGLKFVHRKKAQGNKKAP